jgi:hypothetical protein
MKFSNRRLMWHGMFLFLIGLSTGFAEQHFANVRMALAAHLEGVMNGTFLVAQGSGVERGASCGESQGHCVLGGTLRNLWELAGNDDGGSVWDGGAFSNHGGRAQRAAVAGKTGDAWFSFRGNYDRCDGFVRALGFAGEGSGLKRMS